MTTPSPAFYFNAQAPGVKLSTSAGALITATLDDTAGVTFIEWEVIATDETTLAASYTLSVTSGSVPGSHVTTFNAGAAGTAGLLRARINNGRNSQTGNASEGSDVIATAKWYVPTSGTALEVGVVGEEYQSNSTFGSTGIVNAGLRTAAGGVSASRTLTAGAGLIGGGDLSANRTFDVGSNADGSIVVNANDIQVGVLASDAQHGNRGNGNQHTNAVASGNAGFMSGADKAKLDGIESAADVTDEANVRAAMAAFTADPNVNGRRITSVADPSSAQDAATKASSEAVVTFTRVSTALAAASSSISVNSQKITNLATPTVTTDAATAQYVGTTSTSAAQNEVNWRTASNSLSTNPSFNSKRLTSVADPTGAQDAATMVYVDSAVAGARRARINPTADIPNLSAAALSQDGATLALNDTVVLTEQATQSQNGLYTVSAAGATATLTRASGATVGASFPGMVVGVFAGSTRRGWVWRCSNTVAPTVGSTNISFERMADNVDHSLLSSATSAASADELAKRDGDGSCAFVEVELTQDFGATQSPTFNAGGTTTLNWSAGRTQKFTMTGNSTIAFSAVRDGARYTIHATQDGTGGRTLTWPAAVKFIDGSSDATPHAAASKRTVYQLTVDGSTLYAERLGPYTP